MTKAPAPIAQPYQVLAERGPGRSSPTPSCWSRWRRRGWRRDRYRQAREEIRGLVAHEVAGEQRDQRRPLRGVIAERHGAHARRARRGRVEERGGAAVDADVEARRVAAIEDLGDRALELRRDAGPDLVVIDRAAHDQVQVVVAGVRRCDETEEREDRGAQQLHVASCPLVHRSFNRSRRSRSARASSWR